MFQTANESLAEKTSASKVLIEGAIDSREGWIQQLNCDTVSLNRLLRVGSLRPIPGDKTRLRLDFVGILETRNETCFCLPKIFGAEGKKITSQDTLKTLRCIQQYQSRLARKRVSPSLDAEIFLDDFGSRLALFLRLFAWTSDHGLHTAEFTSLSDDFDHVNWGDTFARGTALHLRTGPIFSEYHGQHELGGHGDIATAQSFILLSLLNELDFLAKLWVSEFDSLFEICRSQLSVAEPQTLELEFIGNLVADAAENATKDHDRELLIMLRMWINSSLRGTSSPRMYGLNAFHTVWEDMCRSALGGEKCVKHSKIAAQPVHVINGEERALATQRPDHLFEIDGEVVIADAKWYRMLISMQK